MRHIRSLPAPNTRATQKTGESTPITFHKQLSDDLRRYDNDWFFNKFLKPHIKNFCLSDKIALRICDSRCLVNTGLTRDSLSRRIKPSPSAQWSILHKSFSRFAPYKRTYRKCQKTRNNQTLPNNESGSLHDRIYIGHADIPRWGMVIASCRTHSDKQAPKGKSQS